MFLDRNRALRTRRAASGLGELFRLVRSAIHHVADCLTCVHSFPTTALDTVNVRLPTACNSRLAILAASWRLSSSRLISGAWPPRRSLTDDQPKHRPAEIHQGQRRLVVVGERGGTRIWAAVVLVRSGEHEARQGAGQARARELVRRRAGRAGRREPEVPIHDLA